MFSETQPKGSPSGLVQSSLHIGSFLGSIDIEATKLYNINNLIFALHNLAFIFVFSFLSLESDGEVKGIALSSVISRRNFAMAGLYKALFMVEPLRGLLVVLLFAIFFHLILKRVRENRIREYERLTGSALSLIDKQSNADDVAVATEALEKTKDGLLKEHEEIIKEAERVLSGVDILDRRMSRLRKLAKALKVPLKA